MSAAPVACNAALRTSVYRYYDENDMLIYVGITHRGHGRNLQHSDRASWWPYVARQMVDHYPDRQTAVDRERELIRLHEPPFNVQHNPNHLMAKQVYLIWRTAARIPPNKVYARLKRCLPLDVAVQDGRSLVLRTHLEHASVASVLRKNITALVVIPQAVGHVKRVTQSGPLALVHCSLKKVVPEVHSATAAVRWHAQEKVVYLRQVMLEADV